MLNSTGSLPNWVCLQIGARQHYANPRTLHKAGLLFGLITDAWMPPGTISSIGGKIAERTQLQRLTQRYHDDLRDARVHSFTSSLMKFEFEQSYHRTRGWHRIIARNEWF